MESTHTSIPPSLKTRRCCCSREQGRPLPQPSRSHRSGVLQQLGRQGLGARKMLEGTVLKACPSAEEGLPIRREGSHSGTTCAPRSKGEAPRLCCPTSPHLPRHAPSQPGPGPLCSPGPWWWLSVGQNRALDTAPPQPGLSQPQASQGSRDKHLPCQQEARRRPAHAAPEQPTPSVGTAKPRLTGQRQAPDQEGTGQAAGPQSGRRGLLGPLSLRNVVPCCARPTQAGAAGIRTTWAAAGPGAADRALLSPDTWLPLTDQWKWA